MKVFVLSSSKGRQITKRLMEIFNGNISLSVILDHEIIFKDKDNFLICSQFLDRVDIEDLLVVVAADVEKFPTNIICKQVLMSSKFNKIICENATIITYGQCAKDTITVASIERDEVLIGLQREVSSIDGEITVPCEIAIKVREQLDNDFILAIASILILTGNCQLLHNIII